MALTGYLLTESGDKLLQEDGYGILLEGPWWQPLKLTIDGNDRTTSISVESIRITNVATRRTNTCSFRVMAGGGFSLAELQEVIISSPAAGKRYFGGYIRKLVVTERGPLLDYDIDCVDYSWYLEHPEALVSGGYSSQSDQAVIQDFMPTSCPDLNVTTYVEAIEADVVDLLFDRATPRKVLEELAIISGADWYVDDGPGPSGQTAYLHYFDSGTNSAPFSLSDSPDHASSFPYEGLYEAKEAPQANKVVVVGRGDVTATRTRGSESDYGWWLTTSLVNPGIYTVAQAEALGDQFLEDLATAPTYECVVRRQGLRAGQDVTLVSATRSINSSFVITEVETRFDGGGLANHRIRMGKYLPSFSDILAKSIRDAELYEDRYDTEAPDNPTGLATYSRFKSVYLAWTNPTQRDLDHIEVWRNSSASWTGATKITEVMASSHTDEIGLWDSTFWYALKAVDEDENTSSGTAWVEGNTDITAPAAPTGLSSATDIVTDADGHIIPYIELAWTDSTTEDVQAHEVEIWYDFDDDASFADEDPIIYRCKGTPLRLSPAPGNIDYQVRVRALDDAQLPSAWTSYDTGTTAKDNVAPANPANLAAEPALESINITVDKPSEYDWNVTEFHVSTTSGFSPSSATLVNSAKVTQYTYPCPIYTTYYVKVRHGDTSGNWSDYSDQESAAPSVQDLIACSDAADDKIYVYEGFSSTVRRSFSAPGSEPTGLAFDGTNLLSCDASANKIYKHSGITSTITTSFASTGGAVAGLTYDPIDGNLVSCDDTANKIYKHDGISNSILTSFAAPHSGPFGLAFVVQDQDLISCDRGTDTIYRHSGITSTVEYDFAYPGAGHPRGLAYGSGGLMSCDDNTGKIYKHAGVTAGTVDEFTAAQNMWGLTWAGK